MKLGSLISGGKDSIFSIYSVLKDNYDVNVLLGMESKNEDSWMFHTRNIDLIRLQAKAMDKEIMIQETEGEKEKELEDLYELINRAVEEQNIDGIVVGALESEYQRERVQKICKDLSLDIVAPIWHKDPKIYMEELLESNFEVLITEVAARGLGKEWLGRKLDKKALEELKKVSEEHGIHLAGEGGEYETLVLDCPLFNSKIKIEESETLWDRNRGSYNIKKASI